MFKTLKNLIPSSVKDAAMRTSSTRIQSYLIVPLIYIFALFTVISEGVLLFHAMNLDQDHALSAQFITVFISILTHHLALLGINKNSKSEPKYSELNGFSQEAKMEGGEKTLLQESNKKVNKDQGYSEEDMI